MPAPTPTAALRVALYTRVSTDMQASKDEGSLDTQEARLRAAVLSRNGPAEITQVFREEGASGKNLARPQVQRLLNAVRNREVDLVMVTRVDRLSRSLLDFYELHRLFEENNVQFVSLNESFDTSTAIGRAMLKLVLVFAELEREQTAERTRLAMRARAERGLWNGGHPPLGYDSEGNGHLTLNVVEAGLVKLIFDKYLALRSSTQVARWLNEQGHRQKQYNSRRAGPKGGQEFTVSAIQIMVTNRLYLGEIDHKGEIFAGQHEAIVDRETFERAGAIVEGNAKNRRGPPLRTQYDYLLTGVLRCACGYSLTTSAGNGRGGRYHYYRCVGIQKKPDHACPVKQVRAERADEAVLEIVREAARDPKLLEEAVAEANRLADHSVKPLRERATALKRELNEAEDTAAKVLTQILGAGISSSVTAKKVLADAETRAEQLRGALAAVEGELAVRETEQLDHEVMVQAIRGFDTAFQYLSLAEKREFLHLMVKEVTLHPDRVEVELYDGKQASRFMEARAAGGRGGGGGENGGSGSTGGDDQGSTSQNDETPAVDQPGFVTGGVWLQTLGRTGNQCQPLESWSVDTRLPHHPAFGIQCEPPPVEVLERAALTELSSPDEEPATVGDAWSPRLQAIRDRLAQARGWKRWLAEASDRRPVDVAKHEGLSRARVSQLMRLLDLAPEVVRDLEHPDRAGPVPSEKQLREVAMIADPFEQVRQYRAMVANAPAAQPAPEEPEAAAPAVQVLNVAPLEVDAPPTAPVHVRGFQHLFERARRYHEMMDGESVRSVVEVARLEGVSPSRVSQLLYLLQLAPPIVAVLDVPEALCPPVTHKEILGIARMKSKSQQIKAFWALVSAAAAWGEGMAAK